MDYENCAMLFQKTKAEVTAIEAETKAKLAPLQEKMRLLLEWMETKAREEGLKNVPTKYGTGFWATHTSASVAEPGIFRDFVIENKLWDLIETRASKVAVKSYIDANKEPPPGVNYKQVAVFNIRANTGGKE